MARTGRKERGQMAKSKKHYPKVVEMDLEQKKVVGRDCPLFRLSYPHLFEPVDFEGDEKFKYRGVMLVGKKAANLKNLQRAFKNAKIEALGKDEKKWPKDTVECFQDGDEKSDQEGYEGCYAITFTRDQAKGRPEIYDPAGAKMEDQQELKAGDYCKASLIAFYYDVGKNRGVSFFLAGLQKIKDGEPLGGSNVASEFDPVDDNDNEGSAEEETGEDEY
jgi:hypothetical protein